MTKDIKHWALSRLRSAAATLNRRQILHSQRTGKPLLLQPINRVEHYYHFLFDLTLPLWRLLEGSPAELTVAVRPFGIFTDRLTQLFGGRVRIAGPECADAEFTCMPLRGMNVHFCHIPTATLSGFKAFVDRRLDIDSSVARNKVLLIERTPPNEYFQKHAVKKGAGASRRSIPNHEALVEALACRASGAMTFLNVRLEELGFIEQIRLFDQAAVVIGQHGAGLANLLWTRAGGSVVELSHQPSLRHFRFLSKQKHHEYRLHTTRGPHAEVDVTAVADLLHQSLGRR